jgi:hypothetical protein
LKAQVAEIDKELHALDIEPEPFDAAAPKEAAKSKPVRAVK